MYRQFRKWKIGITGKNGKRKNVRILTFYSHLVKTESKNLLSFSFYRVKLQSWTKIIGTKSNLRTNSKFQSGTESLKFGSEIRNPTNSLGTRLPEMTGFIDIARRPKILSPKSNL